MAIVVDNKDGEGNPGYRVKLKFPWLNEQESTFWARIAVPMGGPGRGTYVLPEIDDQVLVVFEHGDINRPIVVGALWSKKQEPVEVNQSGKNNTKLIKSRSGHRIVFDDKEGAEKITIVDSTKKNKIVLDSVNKIVKIESDGDIEVIAKSNVIMHSNALKIGTSEGMTGMGKSLLVHAQKAFGLKASNGIAIGGGNTTINTSNGAACSVSGSGEDELSAAPAEEAKDQVDKKERAPGSTRAVAPHREGASLVVPSLDMTVTVKPVGQTSPTRGLLKQLQDQVDATERDARAIDPSKDTPFDPLGDDFKKRKYGPGPKSAELQLSEDKITKSLHPEQQWIEDEIAKSLHLEVPDGGGDVELKKRLE